VIHARERKTIATIIIERDSAGGTCSMATAPTGMVLLVCIWLRIDVILKENVCAKENEFHAVYGAIEVGNTQGGVFSHQYRLLGLWPMHL
jgi:hypothetical protein